MQTTHEHVGGAVSGPRVLPALTERQWMRQVVDLARTFRWVTYHTQLSKWSEAGWPDLALVRPPRFILVELKSDKGKLTDSQRHWLDLLGQCPGVEVHLWRPSQLDEIVLALR